MVHIPYPSSPAAMTAIIRGDVQMGLPACDRGHSACRLRQGENSRRLDRAPIPLFAGNSTLKEAGIDVDADAWMGMIARRTRQRRSVAKDSARGGRSDWDDGDPREACRAAYGADRKHTAEFRARIDGEIARWAPVIKAADIKVN